jgi:hypothetical protein
MEGGASVTLEEVYAQLQGLTTEHKALTAKLEERLKQLEADNNTLRAKPAELNATAAALAQTPKTKSALQEEEEQIKKGMAKMNANNAQWPIPSVATADAWAKFFKESFSGMASKGKKKVPEIAAVTSVLELQGELTDFMMALAEGTFGNEDVRAMVANGLKSYITSYIGQKILQSEGELMKLVAKNDMPGTAVSILGKVKDQIATGRTPIQKRASSASAIPGANAAFAKGALLSAAPGLQKHADAGNKAVADAQKKAAGLAAQAKVGQQVTKNLSPEAQKAKAGDVAKDAAAAAAKKQQDAAAAATKAKLEAPKKEAEAAAAASKAKVVQAQSDAAAAKAAAASKLEAAKAATVAAKAEVKTTKEVTKVQQTTSRDVKHEELKLNKAQMKLEKENAKTAVKAAATNVAEAKKQIATAKTDVEKQKAVAAHDAAVKGQQEATSKLNIKKNDLNTSAKALSASRSTNVTRRYFTDPAKRTGRAIKGTAKATGRVAKGTLKAVANAPSNLAKAAYNAPSSIAASLSRQAAAYKANTAAGREKVAALAANLNEHMKAAGEAERLKMLANKDVALVGKLKQQLTTAIEELERLREEPKSDLRDFNIEAKEKEVAQRKADYEKKESELLTKSENPV